MAPKFPHTLTLARPSIQPNGSLTIPAGSTVKGALFRRRTQRTVGGAGEAAIVVAQAWLPSGTDVRRGDRLTRGADQFEVVTVIQGEDDRGCTDHVGVELVDANAD